MILCLMCLLALIYLLIVYINILAEIRHMQRQIKAINKELNILVDDYEKRKGKRFRHF